MPSPTSLFQPLRTTLFSTQSGPRIPLLWLRRDLVFSVAPWQFSLNSFPCHTSKICARNPFPCHTSKNTRLKALHLPHIQKLAGVGVLLLTRILAFSWVGDSTRQKPLLYILASLRPCFLTSSSFGDFNENYKAIPLSRRFRRIHSLPVSFRRRPPMSHAPSRFSSFSLPLPRPRGAAAPRTGQPRR
jgi:hypothetical protein